MHTDEHIPVTFVYASHNDKSAIYLLTVQELIDAQQHNKMLLESSKQDSFQSQPIENVMVH